MNMVFSWVLMATINLYPPVYFFSEEACNKALELKVKNQYAKNNDFWVCLPTGAKNHKEEN